MKRKNINNKLKINVGLKHCDKCEYYLRCEECVGSLYKEEMPKLNKQIKVLEKALELACERVKYFEQQQDREMGVIEFFGQEIDYDLQAIISQYKEQAKEILKNE